jgi:hypothetical protein
LALRRAGTALICLSGALALLGFTALTLAYETWSGYAIQAAVALVIGLGGMGGGWSLLRRGDRLGPRLMTFPRLAASAASTANPGSPSARVWVRTEPIAALPPGTGRTTF